MTDYTSRACNSCDKCYITGYKVIEITFIHTDLYASSYTAYPYANERSKPHSKEVSSMPYQKGDIYGMPYPPKLATCDQRSNGSNGLNFYSNGSNFSNFYSNGSNFYSNGSNFYSNGLNLCSNGSNFYLNRTIRIQIRNI